MNKTNDMTFLFAGILRPKQERKPTLAIMRSRAMTLLKDAQSKGILRDLVREVVQNTGINTFLPEQYSRYRPVVLEGMIFMMQSLTLKRLSEKIVDQLLLPENASFGQRLFTLIKDMPTLQKLGQIICRNPGIDPEFKTALVDLEDNIQTLNYAHIRPALYKEIRKQTAHTEIIPEKRILAEASVCVVIPAKLVFRTEDGPLDAVLKIVKPRVKKNMAQDLILLNQLMVFLDQHKKEWGMGDFNFSATLAQVGTLLAKEVDLVSEQSHIDQAWNRFKNNDLIRVPKKLPVSTPGMTVMVRLDGTKITDTGELGREKRQKLAEALAAACILKPIQDIDEGGLFHGDPHAGNLAYLFEKDQPRIIFYDWGMLGHLSRLDRIAMVLLTLGIMTGSRKLVFYTADVITKGQLSTGPEMVGEAKAIIERCFLKKTANVNGLLSAIEYLFEKFTHTGVVFSADLMMYEKALLTLKGVLSDVDPSFNRDAYMVRASMGLLVNDAIRFRLFKLFIKEAWRLYRHSLNLFLDMQKVLLWFTLDLARVSRKVPGIIADTVSTT